MKTAPRELETTPLSVDEALARILERVTPLPAEEKPILDALGHVLAEDVRAANDVPPFANSGMDGYAVRASDVAAAPLHLPVTMRIPGGVAVGDYDFVKVVVRELGTMNFWSIAMRPGKPVAFGAVLGKPIFGLPGNPVSALLTFEIFARPALLKLQGRSKLQRPRVTARLGEDVAKPPHLRFFGRAIYDGAARTVRTTGPQGSGILRSMSLANALIDLPIGTSVVPAGSDVTVILTDLPEDH